MNSISRRHQACNETLEHESTKSVSGLGKKKSGFLSRILKAKDRLLDWV